MESVPKELVQAIHNVFRNWHAGGLDHPLWSKMLIAAQRLDDQPAPNLERAVKEILIEALDNLDAQTRADVAQILRLHFIDGLTMFGIANRLGLSENVVYKRQEKAIKSLAEIVWQAESAARLVEVARIASRLEIQEPPPLFGVDDKLAELMAILVAGNSPWLVAVTGIGGIGKTSLADAAVRRMVQIPVFVDVAWVSARQDQFTLWDGLLKASERNPALTLEGLIDAIIEQLEFQDLARLPLAQKQAGLTARFKAKPYLVVIDNMETAADYRALVPSLKSMVSPSKLLLTSRHSLHDYPDVYCLDLDELSEDDSLALLRHELSVRGLADRAGSTESGLSQVYGVVGGNPLALKLLAGQMYALSLPKVIESLQEARGRSVEDLYRHIYWQSWRLLTDHARKLWSIMPLVAEGGGEVEHLAILSELDDESLLEALKQLATLCLVNVRGTVDERRYGIHRLTVTFLLNEVLKWQALA